ncbi:exopolyphosphatase [Calditrichota bacterium]
MELKFAAIDIGSNAIRLLLSKVFENGNEPYFKKESLIRMPVRLGDEAFSTHIISDTKIEKLLNTLIGFKYLIDAYQPIDLLACATSAMREAQNGPEIISQIRTKTGINLEIVDGKKEASIIYANHIEQHLKKTNTYLYVDVGGGSTELTLFTKKKTALSKSFDIGTVRLLNKLVHQSQWDEMKQWIKNATVEYDTITGIGSGGNINKIFRLAAKKDNKPLNYKEISSIYDDLKILSFEERIRELGLRPDRADVILPASEIYLSVMEWAKIKKIYVPQIGLADGLIHIMYEKYKAAQES